jgi:hypothetical protein
MLHPNIEFMVKVKLLYPCQKEGIIKQDSPIRNPIGAKHKNV